MLIVGIPYTENTAFNGFTYDREQFLVKMIKVLGQGRASVS